MSTVCICCIWSDIQRKQLSVLSAILNKLRMTIYAYSQDTGVYIAEFGSIGSWSFKQLYLPTYTDTSHAGRYCARPSHLVLSGYP